MANSFTHYKGNPNLKAAAVRHSYTEEQIKEFVKWAKDPAYFIERYVIFSLMIFP